LDRIGRADLAMISPAAAFVMASYRGGNRSAPGYETLVIGAAIVVMALACVPIFIYLRRRYRRPRPVGNQWQALAVMGELCAHSWQAQITLYGWGAPVPPEAPPSRVPLVELEWKQFEEDSDRVAVARRVWAPTIEQALQMMVEDRRTDITFEQIEEAVAEEEDGWNDPG
jgi:hypothetical protein